MATGYVLLILMGLTMLIVAIISASLTCKPLCCRPVKQELVNHHPNQYNNQAPNQPNQVNIIIWSFSPSLQLQA